MSVHQTDRIDLPALRSHDTAEPDDEVLTLEVLLEDAAVVDRVSCEVVDLVSVEESWVTTHSTDAAWDFVTSLCQMRHKCVRHLEKVSDTCRSDKPKV